jgi:hypothetical protein
MGIVYCGPFAAAIDEGTRYGHEGYAVQVLEDGLESPSWTTEFREYRAGCDCGWRGARVYPPTEAGETAATDEWDTEHLQVLIGRVADGKAVPVTRLLGLISELRRELTAAVAARGVDEALTERERGRVEVIEDLERHLEEFAVDTAPRPSTWPRPTSGGMARRGGGAW